MVNDGWKDYSRNYKDYCWMICYGIRLDSMGKLLENSLFTAYMLELDVQVSGYWKREDW